MKYVLVKSVHVQQRAREREREQDREREREGDCRCSFVSGQEGERERSVMASTRVSLRVFVR